MSSPDLETAIIQRLFACNQEIIGTSGRVYQQAPAIPPGIGEFPIMYSELGPILGSLPRQNDSAGRYRVERNYTVKLAVSPLETVTDIDNLGADALNNTLPWFSILRNYFLSHPRLETSALPALPYIDRDIHYIETGNAQIVSPGGTSYVGIVVTLNILAFTPVTRIS